MNIKTVTTSDGVNVVDFGSAASRFYWIENLGSTTVYVSGNENIVPDGDNVKVLSAGCGTMVENLGGKVYILGAGKFQITNQGDKFPPFRNAPVADGGVMASGNPVQIDGLQGGVPFSEMVVSGKNLITYPYTESTKTVNGITFTDNGDGTITANGTATANATFLLARNFGFEKEGNYFLSGCPSGGGHNLFYINWYQNHTGVTIKNYNDYGSGVKIPYQHIFSENNSLAISIIAGATVENLVFRPQLELGSTPTEYEPPITGRDLTVGVSGKNLISGNIINKTGTVTDNSDSWIIEWTAAMYVRFDKIFLKPNTDYTISWWQKSDNGTDCVKIGVINGDDKSPIIEQSSAEIKTGAEYTLCSFTFNSGNNRNIYVQFLRASATGTVYVKKSIQLELGSTATPYEPYHGAEHTITPNSNPYVIPNDIRQQDGLNVVSVSEGKISVTGVRKNAAVKKIWDKIDELTTAIIVSNGETIE